LSTDEQSHASAQYCLAAKRLISRRLCVAIGRTPTTTEREKVRPAHRNGAEGQKSYWVWFHGDVTVKGEPMTKFGQVRRMGASFALTISGSEQ
jgi:hypothetical protein